MSRPPKVGRTAVELKSYPWPVVTRGMLASRPGDGADGEDWNDEKRWLIEGLQALKEAELRLCRIGGRGGALPVQDRVRELLAELERVRKRWPLTVI